MLEGIVSARYNDKGVKPFNIYATPEFKKAVELANKWYKAGYFPRDAKPNADAYADWRAQKFAVQLNQWFPETSVVGPNDPPVVGKSLNVQFLPQGGIPGYVSSVCSSSKNPERALMLIQLLHTDPKLYNLVAHGIEGKHWVFTNKGKRVIASPPNVSGDSGYTPATDWIFGGYQTVNYFRSVNEIKSRAESKRINNAATVSTLYGFNMNPDPVKSEIAQVNAVIGESRALVGGRVDPETALPQFLQKLKAAGIDRIVAEADQQISDWKASKP